MAIEDDLHHAAALQQEVQRADSPLLAEAAEIGARRIFVDGLVRLPESTGGDLATRSISSLRGCTGKT